MSKRFHVLVGPRGHLTCVAADNDQLLERYARWTRLITVNRPLTTNLANESKDWAIAVYGL